MTIFHFDLLAIVAASAFQFAPVPADITPRNEVERMVLAREETASHDLEDWLVVHRDGSDAEEALRAAGFRRVRPTDACANYVYSRQITATLVRGVSIIACPDKRPFVLRTDETPGPWLAPRPGVGLPPAIAPRPLVEQQ